MTRQSGDRRHDAKDQFVGRWGIHFGKSPFADENPRTADQAGTRPQPSQAFVELVEEIRGGSRISGNAARSSARTDTPQAVPPIVIAPAARDGWRQTPASGVPAAAAGSNGVMITGPATHAPTGSISHESRSSHAERAAPGPPVSAVFAGFTTRLTSAAIILIVVGTVAALAVAKLGPSASAETNYGFAGSSGLTTWQP